MSSGSDLRHVREARRLSLGEAARRIRCPESVLAAVEADETPDIAPIYLKGHLRRYAELLGLDEDSTRALLAAHEGEAPEVRTVFENKPPAQASDRWLRVASYVLGSLLVGTLAWQMTHEAVRLARVDHATEVTTEEPAAEPSATGSHVNASMVPESIRVPAGGQPANAGAPAWEALETARQARQRLAAGEHLLQVETSADTWVEITGADDVSLEQDLLRGGDVREYRGAGPFRISLGRASAVRLALDGTAVDLEPYTRDDVARLLLDPEALAEPRAADAPE